MKIATIIGARPQFIKAAVVSRYIRENCKDIVEIIIHTGQHYDKNMSDVFFNQMDIPKPDYSLNINGLGHGAMTGQMLEKIENVLIETKPDLVLVYGDTNTTLAGALAAKKLHIKLAHVEAGLRSYNMKMPEEVNRILTDRISDLLFCPTERAVENLKDEGFLNFDASIIKTGDVMQDAAIYYSSMAVKPNMQLEKDYILTTIHRAENTDDLNRLSSILEALSDLGEKYQIVLPLHPRTRKIIENNSIKYNTDRIHISEPVGYFEILYLLKNCSFVMTDSGGMQKEAFFFGKKCITLRDETEWVELVENNFNIIAGSDKNNILNSYNKIFDTCPDFDVNLYGEGQAGKNIVESIIQSFKR